VANRTRTCDNSDHNRGLYQLSYSHHTSKDVGLANFFVKLRRESVHSTSMYSSQISLLLSSNFIQTDVF
jgi:hypothetical protein